MKMSAYDNINILEETPDKVVFELADVTPMVANKLRVALLEGVPTMSIDTVEFITNTTVMHDDELRARLELIPICADPRLFEKYNGQFDENNSIVFTIDCSDAMTIMTSDMKWEPVGDQGEMFPDNIYPIHDNIPIIKMKDGQSLKVRMVCIKGTGDMHVKWSPVGTVGFRLKPNIIVNDFSEELVDLCPHDVFDLEELVVVKNPLNCNRCNRCVRAGLATVKSTKGHYIFTSESIGQYGQMDLVREAIIASQ